MEECGRTDVEFRCLGDILAVMMTFKTLLVRLSLLRVGLPRCNLHGPICYSLSSVQVGALLRKNHLLRVLFPAPSTSPPDHSKNADGRSILSRRSERCRFPPSPLSFSRRQSVFSPLRNELAFLILLRRRRCESSNKIAERGTTFSRRFAAERTGNAKRVPTRTCLGIVE